MFKQGSREGQGHHLSISGLLRSPSLSLDMTLSSLCTLLQPVLLHHLQMRNLILSAFPRSMRLPDPFTPNLKVCGWLV
jgi:hypothetical protein